MRTPARSKGNRSQISSVASLAAPIGGWNARDALGAMDSKDAVILENWFPATTDVLMRYGYSSHATGLPGQVESLMVYSSATTDKMFAVSSGGIYDVTGSGAVGAADVSGMSNSRFQYVNISTAGGHFLMAVNGANKLRYYNGSTWTYDGGGTYSITGVDTANVSQISLFKHRVWLIEKDSLSAWYLPTDSIAGAASEIDLSGVAMHGGYLVAMGTWTIDAGYGVDDMAVFVTSNGEVIVYKGTDPSDSTKWALSGIWKMGSPVGTRCLMKFAGDLLLITQDGLLPLSGALQSSRLNPRVALTDKIQYATSEAISTYGSQFGWETLAFPRANQLYLNVPIAQGQQEQYVMNTITKSWCKFTGWNANCWALLRDNPYFGGDGFVGLAWDGTSDDGQNINADALQAFNYFGNPGKLKKYGMARPIMKATGYPNILADLNIDFDTSDTTAPLNYTAGGLSTWDSSTWDVDLWGGTLQILKEWQTVTGVGYSAGMRIKAASNQLELRWVSTDITFEGGGVL